MPNLARSTAHGLLGLSVLAVLACADSTPSEPRTSLIVGTGSSVSLKNDGPVALENVRVRTSEADLLPVVVRLAPGATAGPFPVSVMHTDPLVELTMQGQRVTAHPVEGFTGFNPPRAAGAYLIRVRPGANPNTLDVRVTTATP